MGAKHYTMPSGGKDCSEITAQVDLRIKTNVKSGLLRKPHLLLSTTLL